MNRMKIEIILAIAKKDAKIYFFKWPNITFGLFFPIIMYLSFAMGRISDLAETMPGLIAIAILFGTGAIQSVALPLEKATGTFNRFLSAPISLTSVVVAKVIAGLFFGLVISAVYSVFIFGIMGISIVYFPLFLVALFLSSLIFSALGLVMAAPFRDIPQAMPPATLVRVLMVFLSNVFIPIETFPVMLQYIANILPLKYAVDLIGQSTLGVVCVSSLLLNLALLLVYAIACIYGSVLILRKSLK